MVTTVLGLLVVLIAACIVLWIVGRAVIGLLQSRFRRPQDAAPLRTERSAPPFGRLAAEPVAPFPVPEGTTLLRTESVAISQAGNPAPMLHMDAITGAAYWYRAALSYPDVAAWYRERLPAEGWQEEAGHGQLRVFRRAHTLLWLADGEDAAVWQRLTIPLAASRPAASPSDMEAVRPDFTVLIY